jgi:hypothetical protein
MDNGSDYKIESTRIKVARKREAAHLHKQNQRTICFTETQGIRISQSSYEEQPCIMSLEQTLKEVEAAMIFPMRTECASTKEQRKAFQVDFSTTKMTEQHHFDNFEQKAETAVVLWHMNSGFNKFSGLEDL